MFLRDDLIDVLMSYFTDQIHHQDATLISFLVNKIVKNKDNWLKCG